MNTGLYSIYDAWMILLSMRSVKKSNSSIRKYIQNQLQEGIAADQISISELIDPFTGEPVKDGKK